MATTNRVGTWLIVAGGLILLGVMIYALSLGSGGLSPGGGGLAAEVAVYFPDTNSWRNFRIGVGACVEKGLIEVSEQGTDSVLVRSRRSGRLVRFTWDGSLGLRETRASLARRLESEAPPVAVVGSTNSALTVGLARELAGHETTAAEPGPVLLVPAASAILVEPSEGETDAAARTAPIPLLDVFPHRTFRFCLNNAQLAELAVGLLAEWRHERPTEVVLIADGFDPFSEDLAAFFAWAIERRFPGTGLLRSEPKPGGQGRAGSPSADEIQLAETIWSKARQARSESADGSVWVLLTTQGEPARRMLEVLRAYAPPRPPDNVRVLSGDGIGRLTLASFAGALPFPIISSSSTSAAVPDLTALRGSGTGQIEAEIVSAVVAGLDREEADLASALRMLDIPSGDPAAIGRSLVFAAGERIGDDLGHVLEARPDETVLLAHEPGTGGRWVDFRWSRDGWVEVPDSTGADRR